VAIQTTRICTTNTNLIYKFRVLKSYESGENHCLLRCKFGQESMLYRCTFYGRHWNAFRFLYKWLISLIVYSSVSQTYLLADPFWFRKIITNSHILANVNMGCPDDGYPKFKICISEQISDSYEYVQETHVPMPCMIGPELQ